MSATPDIFGGITCDGACSRARECSGIIRRVKVTRGEVYWGLFNYCQTAVSEDEASGYTVTPIASATPAQPSLGNAGRDEAK